MMYVFKYNNAYVVYFLYYLYLKKSRHTSGCNYKKENVAFILFVKRKHKIQM